MNKQDLLIEIGTEELPPKALPGLSAAFSTGMETGLNRLGLTFSGITPFASPRRLALLIHGLDEQQADSEVEKLGPAIQAAFDAEGNPTRAAEGFARSCGVSVADLEQKADGKVTKLVFRAIHKGQLTTALIPGLVQQALADLPIPRRMRWGSSRDEFVRPVHWAILLFGNEVIPARILGVDTGNQSRGTPFPPSGHADHFSPGGL
jgi:glycyl-tRNA synthetase beta chain